MKKSTLAVLVIFLTFLVPKYCLINLSLKVTSGVTVNVKDYGAEGNGASDDKSAIEKAIKQLPVQGGKVYFPSGTYYISRTIDIPSKVELYGKATIKSNSDLLIFQVGDVTTFSGLSFSNCNIAIYGEARRNIKINNCKFQNIQTAAVSFYGCSNCEIKNSKFFNIIKNSIVIDRDSTLISIRNNDFDNIKTYAGFQEPQISAHIYVLNGDRINVVDNSVRNNGGQGIAFSYNSSTNKGTTNSIAKGNLCEGNGQEGITIFGGDPKVSGNNSIIGNICRNNRLHQIECWEADSCIIEDNTVSEASSEGNLAAIMVYKANYIKVVSNNILHARSNGIDIANACKFCMISDNKINNTNLSGNLLDYMGHGITLDSLGGLQPYCITIKNNIIVSVNITKTININKSGIYSTSNTNHNNVIEGNTVKGYSHEVHPYAIQTTNSSTLKEKNY